MVDHTILYCCHCGEKTVVPLHKRFDPARFLEEYNSNEPIEIQSKYHHFSEILNLIEDLRQKHHESLDEIQRMKEIIESDKQMNKIHKWQLGRMTYVEEVIRELRKMNEENLTSNDS